MKGEMNPNQVPDDIERYRTILILGAPGSGKGTQGAILGAIPGYVHLSCGEVFRKLNPDTDLGRTFLSYSSDGKLVPDPFTVQLWTEHLRRLVQTGGFTPNEQVLVLDGIPRNLAQAELMAPHIDLRLVVHLQTADEEGLVSRIRRRALHENRLDDMNEQVVRQRFREYASETEPLLGYYPEDRIEQIDAGRSPTEVLRDVLESVNEAAAADLA